MTQAILNSKNMQRVANDNLRPDTHRLQTIHASLPSLRSRPAWLKGRCLAMTWIVLLIYGTLIPFDFDFSNQGDGVEGLGSFIAAILTSVSWRSATGPWQAQCVDLLTNLLLYGPLGLFVRLGAQRHRWHWVSQMVMTLLVLFLVSYLLECAQSLSPSRVGSWYDVAMNTTGGLLFAIVAVRVNLAVRWVTFFVYRKAAFVLRQLLVFVHDLQNNRSITVALIGLDIVLIALWLTMNPSNHTAMSVEVNWLPFARQFEASYDVAMMQIGRQLAHYCLLAALLSIHLLIMPIRHRTGWLVLAVVLLATWPLTRTSNHMVFGGDVTEPIIALMATGSLITMIHVLAHAVRRSDRRKSQSPITLDLRRA